MIKPSTVINVQAAVTLLAVGGTILLAALNRGIPSVITNIDFAVFGSLFGAAAAGKAAPAASDAPAKGASDAT